jgi:hypothetical protein
MAILTLKNRYREPFVGMYDGVEYTVDDTLAVPDYVAQHLKRQSIYRDNPVTGNNDYRLGILELGDPVDEVVEIPADPFDRSDTDHPKVKYIATGIRSSRPAQREGTGQSQVSTKER